MDKESLGTPELNNPFDAFTLARKTLSCNPFFLKDFK